MNENESLTVTLTLENNEELECAVLNIFEAEEPGLENIEEDEEFDRVSAIFNEWLDTQDFGDIDLDALDDLED